MNFFLLGRVVETQNLFLFSLGLLPVLSRVFLCYFLSLLMLFMAVTLLESEQSVMWSRVCGFSGLPVMAASDSEGSPKAVGLPAGESV